MVEDDIKILATSPSAGQLRRGLRSEVAKLLSQIDVPEFQDAYELMSEEIFIKGARDTKFCSFVTGSAENKESLAGLHAKKVIILVDEASAVSQDIYDTLVGNLTTTGSSMVQTTNPVRPSGPFYNLFNDSDAGQNWHKITLTAFGIPWISDTWIQMIEDEYGKDSDFYRMRVLGEFPKAAASTFIPGDIIDEALGNTLKHMEYVHYPIVIGVDVARFGDDETVFVLRQGPKILDIQQYKGLDAMEVVAELVEYQQKHHAAAIFVDGIGIGAGVVDRCKELNRQGHNLPVRDVVVSTKAYDDKTYSNLRSECWGKMRDWIRGGADIPKGNKDLEKQLRGMQYGFNNRMQIQLMTKKDIKSKLLMPSPDIGDALSLTFAGEVFAVKNGHVSKRNIRRPDILWA
jgi:hypothetical protein